MNGHISLKGVLGYMWPLTRQRLPIDDSTVESRTEFGGWGTVSATLYLLRVEDIDYDLEKIKV